MHIPKYYINGTLNEKTLRPGSFWTKYGNYKIYSRVSEMQYVYL